ncbi:MAG: 7-cyano-7-deazaguanine synthase QueC [Methylohalobius sp.]|nr:7-cyano-7-deazaguanine synthase QueC [Methylohalobius sp.]
MKKAVVLLSGGLDSFTTFLIARSQGFLCYALSFDYGQRQRAEIKAAQTIAQAYGAAEHKILHIGLNEIGGSALTDPNVAVPEAPTEGIPITYVPARNTVFLAFALGYAEVLGALDIFIGVNAVDYSGYPDCRPEYIQAFEHLANLATKAGVEGGKFHIHTPLIYLSKAQIIHAGLQLGADYSLTVSCYTADSEGRACGRCDACRFRRQGFAEAGVEDPTRYQA